MMAMADETLTDLTGTPRRGAIPRASPIVPRDSISGRALIAVVAIMTFLASLTTGAVVLIQQAANEWQSDIARELTIQVRPVAGRDIETDVQRAAALAKGIPGVAATRAMSKQESAQLLEPWLGVGLTLDELPVPRMIVLTLASGQQADLAQLRSALSANVPSAALDDHRSWIERMRAMARSAVLAGICNPCADGRSDDLVGFICDPWRNGHQSRGHRSAAFRRRQKRIYRAAFSAAFPGARLQGGAIGGGVAILVFLILDLAIRLFGGSAAGEQASALFGSFSLGPAGYVAVLANIVLIALVTAFTSRQTVNRTLEAID